MGALAKVTTIKRGRDYAQHAIPRVLAILDDDDRAWLTEKLAAPHHEVNATTIANEVIAKAVPEYAPRLDFVLDYVDFRNQIREYRGKLSKAS